MIGKERLHMKTKTRI